MLLFSLLHSAFIPTAHAVTLTNIGAGGPGVSDMWSSITGLFPFVDKGVDLPGTVMANFQKYLTASISTVAVIALTYAAIKIIYGGVTGQGTEEGKKILRNVIIGLVIAIMSEGIIHYVFDLLKKVKG